jgi:hypothetical protein
MNKLNNNNIDNTDNTDNTDKVGSKRQLDIDPSEEPQCVYFFLFLFVFLLSSFLCFDTYIQTQEAQE